MNANPYVFKQKTATRSDAPLVFAFHGTGADENQLFALAEQVLPDAAVVAPRGDVDEHGALRFFRRKAEDVYDLADLKRRTDAIAAFVGERKAAAAARRTVGIGYSNGANILAPPAASWRVCSGISRGRHCENPDGGREKRCSSWPIPPLGARGPELGPNVRPWCARRARSGW
jgi:poly(3-hydroxybutyrate) depolymerase